MRDLWRGLVVILISACFAVLWGCADSSSRTGDDKKLDIKITVNNYKDGTVNIDPELGVTANDGAVTQITKDTSTISPTTKAVMAEGASQSSLVGEGGSALFKGIKAVVETITPTPTKPTGKPVVDKPQEQKSADPQTPTDIEGVKVSTHFDHYFSLGDADTLFDTGPTFMMCEDSPRWDACYFSGQGKVQKMTLHSNQDKNRDLWYIKGIGDGGDGVVVCDKGGELTAFQVEARGQSKIFPGDCR